MRVRVHFDVRLPLKKHKMLRKRDGSVTKIVFKYERLPSFCFVCGIIGHMDKHCPKIYALNEVEEEPEKGWGVELRAPSRAVQEKYKDRWERGAGGEAVVEENTAEGFSGESPNEALQGGRDKETMSSPGLLASRKRKGHGKIQDSREMSSAFNNPLFKG